MGHGDELTTKTGRAALEWWRAQLETTRAESFARELEYLEAVSSTNPQHEDGDER